MGLSNSKHNKIKEIEKEINFNINANTSSNQYFTRENIERYELIKSQKVITDIDKIIDIVKNTDWKKESEKSIIPVAIPIPSAPPETSTNDYYIK